MVTPSLIRRISFTATHFYRNPKWTEARNLEVFGSYGTPHPHDFTLELTISGPIDPDTGYLVDLTTVDALLEERIYGRLHGATLNTAFEEFRTGALQPTTEVLVVLLWKELAPAIPEPAVLRCLRLFEDETLGAELTAEGAGS